MHRGKLLGLLALAELQIVIVLYFWWQSSGELLLSGAGGMLVSLGRLAGFAAALMVLFQLFLASRSRILEPLIGFDSMMKWHRSSGRWIFLVLLLHPTLLIVGYASLSNVDWLEQYQDLLTRIGVPFASIALLLIVTLSLVAMFLRKRISYEWWWRTHLLMYLAVLLAFVHQVATGTTSENSYFQWYWIGLYVFVFGNTAVFRLGRPIYFRLRHQFRVIKVTPETADSVSITISGKRIDAFSFRGGQFAKWYFLTPGYWTEFHPFSFSHEPNGKSMRLTVKAVGDYSQKLQTLPVGTQVMIDGPYGIFTAQRATAANVVLVAAGSGITPVRAMLPELIASGKPIQLLYASSSANQIILKSELDGLTAACFQVNYFTEDRRIATGDVLKAVGKDTQSTVIYLCCPPPMTEALRQELVAAGIPSKSLIYEYFAL